MSSADALLHQLKSHFDQHHDGPQPTARRGTHTDSVDGQVPQLVVAVHNIDQLSRVVAFADEHRLSLTPKGGGTQMNWGGPLEQVDILVDLSAMNQIIDYQPADMTITVQAGMTIDQLQTTLAQKQQFLPIDPALNGHATVGGIVATHAAGPLSLAYGTLRDYVIGVRVVRANGDITKAGGRVVKNAAGYELCKLYTGSLGTLGVIAEVTFMVRPVPEEKSLIFIPLTRIESVEPVLTILLDSTLEPSLLELLNLEALDMLSSPSVQTADDTRYGLLVGFTGSAQKVVWQTDNALQLIADLPTPNGHELQGLVVPWDETYDRLLKLRRPRPESTVFRASLLSSEVASFFDRAEKVLADNDVTGSLVAHAGTGIVHLYFDTSAKEDKLDVLFEALLKEASATPTAPSVPPIDPVRGQQALPQLAPGAAVTDVPGLGDLEALRRLMTGNLVIESAPRAIRERLPLWGRQQANHTLMSEVKKRLDPHATLNKGRAVGA